LDATTGNVIWSFDACAGSGIGGSGGVEVASGVLYYVGFCVYALNAADGSVLWHLDNWSNNGSAEDIAVENGVVYAVDSTNVIAAITQDPSNPTSGMELWRSSSISSQPPCSTTVEGVASLAVADGLVYLHDSSLGIDAVNPSNGDEIWDSCPDSGNPGAGYSSNLAVANGVVYAIGNVSFDPNNLVAGPIYALDAQAGTVLWQNNSPLADTGAEGSLAVANGVLYLGGRSADSSSYYLDALSTSDGSVLEQFPLGGTAIGPVIANGRVYVESNIGATLYALGLAAQSSVSPDLSTVTASPASVPADGSTTSTITVSLKDTNGNPVSGKTVTLAQSLSGGGTSHSTISGGGSTGSDGIVTFTVRDSTVENVTYTATDATDSVALDRTATVAFTPTCAHAPTDPPSTVVLLANGLNSSIRGGTYNPVDAAISYCSEGESSDPATVQDMIGNWMENSQPGVGTRLTDTLASTGAVLLPFSYRGAQLSGPSSAPTFTFNGYTGTDPGTTPPNAAATTMNHEITSIHAVWPAARILVIGHSEGGLVSEGWWIQSGAANPSGVAQVFALDSPLNGVADAPACPNLCGIGRVLVGFFKGLWMNQATNEQLYIALDSKTHLFTPIGTWGDPIYDISDYTAAPTDETNIGMISQLYLSEPSCASSGYDAASSSCAPVSQSYVDPCGPLNDGGPPNFGLLPPVLGGGSLYLHGVVKNCPGVISKIMSYVTSG
jgi:outer membrane protein assembly factor BamB